MNTVSFQLIVFVLLAINSPIVAQQTGRLTNRQISSIDSTIELMKRELGKI